MATLVLSIGFIVSVVVGEHDLFGDDVSDSEDEGQHMTGNMEDDDSRLSMPDTDSLGQPSHSQVHVLQYLWKIPTPFVY